MTADNPFGEMIYSYTRAQAIDDGELIDVSETAKEAGIKFPVAITRAAHGRYVGLPEGVVEGSPYALVHACQDVRGRLWDVVWMMRAAIRQKAGNSDAITFKLHVALPDRGDWQSNERPPERGCGMTRETHRQVTLKALCHSGDNAEPVITIMLPDED